jgi:hypothetical protein
MGYEPKIHRNEKKNEPLIAKNYKTTEGKK